MRVTVLIIITILTLGLASGSARGQARRGNPPVLAAVRMVDGRIGWALAEGDLLRTTDGGAHWRDVTPRNSSGGTIGVYKMFVLSSSVAWVTTSSEVYRTMDGGRTWRSGAAIHEGDITAISFVNPRQGWLIASLGFAAGSEFVDVYRTFDGGASWKKLAETSVEGERGGLPRAGTKSNIVFSSATMGWITGPYVVVNGLYLYVTRDGARTWRWQSLPLPPGLTLEWYANPQPPKFFTIQDGVLPVLYALLNASRPEHGWLVVFYTTHDGGRTWTYATLVQVPEQPWRRPAIGLAGMNHAWVLHGSTLYASSDGGRQWITMPPNPLLADVVQLDFVSPKVGWAVRNSVSTDIQSKPDLPFLLKTVDGGLTWTPVAYAIVR